MLVFCNCLECENWLLSLLVVYQTITNSSAKAGFVIVHYTSKTYSIYLPVDKLEHGWAGQLEQCCWQVWICMLEQSWLEQTDLNNAVGTITINHVQHCSYMIEHVVREWRNNKIEQRCYNNHELGCCIKSSFACSNICTLTTPVDLPSCIQYVETWLNNTVILPILFYHVNSVIAALPVIFLCMYTVGLY